MAQSNQTRLALIQADIQNIVVHQEAAAKEFESFKIVIWEQINGINKAMGTMSINLAKFEAKNNGGVTGLKNGHLLEKLVLGLILAGATIAGNLIAQVILLGVKG